MFLRRTTTAVLAVAALFVAGACSDDEPDSTTTTVEPVTQSTLSDEDYAAAIEESIDDLEAAEGFCGVADPIYRLADPATSAQVEDTIAIIDRSFTALSELLAPTEPEAAAALTEAITTISQGARSSDYSVEYWEGTVEQMVVDVPEFGRALEKVRERYLTECQDESTTDPENSGTEPERTDEG